MDSQFKVVLVGNKGVGKTTFIKRHLTGNFDAKYIATMGVEVTPLTFYTNHGTIVLKVWDCAGDPNSDGYYQGAQGCICMYSAEDNSHKSADSWLNSVHGVAKGIPAVFCCNKMDAISGSLPGPGAFKLWATKHYSISTMNGFRFMEPFLGLARMLMKNKDLKFVDAPPILPNIVEQMTKQYWNDNDINNPMIKQHWNNNTKEKVVQSVIQQQTQVSHMSIPGWKIKITYEFQRDESSEQ